MSLRKTFVARVLADELRPEDIDDEVEAWHKSKEKNWTSLAHWLGLTEKEYARWVEHPKTLAVVLEQRRRDNDARSRTYDGEPINPDLGEGRYQDALRRFRKRIAEGLELDLDDCNITGGKHTHATWGLCDGGTPEAYPDLNDHTFPARVASDLKHGYPPLLSPRDPPEGATCPMDRGPKGGQPVGHSGCFYRCRLFQPVKGTLPPGERIPRRPTREEALRLYDQMIAAREEKYGRKTTKDDGEEGWKPGGGIV